MGDALYHHGGFDLAKDAFVGLLGASVSAAAAQMTARQLEGVAKFAGRAAGFTLGTGLAEATLHHGSYDPVRDVFVGVVAASMVTGFRYMYPAARHG